MRIVALSQATYAKLPAGISGAIFVLTNLIPYGTVYIMDDLDSGQIANWITDLGESIDAINATKDE